MQPAVDILVLQSPASYRGASLLALSLMPSVAADLYIACTSAFVVCPCIVCLYSIFRFFFPLSCASLCRLSSNLHDFGLFIRRKLRLRFDICIVVPLHIQQQIKRMSQHPDYRLFNLWLCSLKLEVLFSGSSRKPLQPRATRRDT